MTIVYLGLGTNLGDRAANLEMACQHLEKFMRILAKSTTITTKAQYLINQPDFLNLVIQGETALSAFDLLTLVKKIEQEMGRIPCERYGPRLIDIDILYYGEEVVQTPDLVIPHPYVQERQFVLEPLCEIAPQFFCPKQKKTIQLLYQELKMSKLNKQ